MFRKCKFGINDDTKIFFFKDVFQLLILLLRDVIKQMRDVLKQMRDVLKQMRDVNNDNKYK